MLWLPICNARGFTRGRCRALEVPREKQPQRWALSRQGFASLSDPSPWRGLVGQWVCWVPRPPHNFGVHA
eukprot:9949376-Alexandrium_andersonii.AAC.1